MKSYHGDASLKSDMIKEMELHRQQDDLIKWTYSKMNGKFRGCAVGCGIESLNRKRGLKIANYGDHTAYAEALGIPEWLARLEDSIFENLPEEESKLFPVRFLEAIPVEVDLEPVKWKFCAFILNENIERVLTLKDISDELKKQVVDAVRGCLNLFEKAIESCNWNASATRSAESAASTARSAARSAESAAWRAARSAARSAESAAWNAKRAARSAESAALSAASSVASTAWSAARSAKSAALSAARSAASTARSAASAALSAASSVASTASSAESAALSAASAAYSRYSKELLRLLEAQQ